MVRSSEERGPLRNMDEKKIVVDLCDKKQKKVVELIYERDQDRKIVVESVSRICEREHTPNIVKLNPKQDGQWASSSRNIREKRRSRNK